MLERHELRHKDGSGEMHAVWNREWRGVCFASGRRDTGKRSSPRGNIRRKGVGCALIRISTKKTRLFIAQQLSAHRTDGKRGKVLLLLCLPLASVFAA